jgi:hydroxymethylglutaryl-CoA reductase
MVKLSLEMLENPDASKLMQIVATLGLAQNFAALRSLTTSGIQVGHMKMHLNNMLNQYQATQEERVLVMQHFTNQTISHSLVIEFLEKIRKNGEKAIL